MIYLYWTPRFLHEINSFGTKIKNIKLDRTHVAKLNSYWNPIFTLNQLTWHKNLKT